MPRRVDVYTAVHKAVRAALFELATAAGRLDATERSDTPGVLTLLDDVFELLADHNALEEEFLHPSLGASAPELLARLEEEHVELREAKRQIRGRYESLAVAREDDLDSIALEAYHSLAAFVADYLRHLTMEEQLAVQALQTSFSDEELLELQGKLRSGMSQRQLGLLLRWMLPSLAVTELSVKLKGIRAVSPAAYDQVSELAKRLLPDERWRKVELRVSGGPLP